MMSITTAMAGSHPFTSCQTWMFTLVFVTMVSVVVANQSPQFTSDFPHPLWLYENHSIAISIGTLKATDPDSDILQFDVVGDAAQNLLRLEKAADKEANIFLRQPLDREVVPDYTVVYEVTDFVNTVRKPADIYVVDVNDNAPTFINLPYRADIPEDTLIGASVYKVSATDSDLGLNALVKYKITVSHDIFSINEADGTVTLNAELNFEKQQFYQLEIMALNEGEYVTLSSTVDLIVNVVDVADNAPVFLDLPYIGEVFENAPVGFSILQVAAMDGDKGINNAVNFTFVVNGVPGTVRYFGIDPETGIVSVREPLDREAPSVLEKLGIIDMTIMTQEVTPPGTPPYTATAPITLRIMDINDQVPTFSQAHYNATILENSQMHIPVSMVPENIPIRVFDYDEGNNGRFELYLEQFGQPFDVFDVDPKEAQNVANLLLRVKDSSKLNYEANEAFSFFIYARENKTTEGRLGSTEVTVYIQDVNDNWPEFTQTEYQANIEENAPLGTFVTTITASDSDSGTWGTITYSLRGSGANMFHIDPNNGGIFVNVHADVDHSLLDRETQDMLYMTVEAVDGGGLRTSVPLVVSLGDKNDKPPQIARIQYDGYVVENRATLERPLFIEATDLDLSPNDEIGFFIIAGDPFGNFTIDFATGEITLSRGSVDYEAMDSSLAGVVNLTVKAEDKGTPPLSSTVQVLIHVQDANDESPYFLQSAYPAEISEDRPGGTSVTEVLALDNDGTEPNNEIIYRIENGANDKFRIDALTGAITVESGANLDRDVYGSSYTLHVAAIDRGTPALTGHTQVLVNITDINNKVPIFDPPERITTVSEAATLGQQFYDFVATDLDENAVLRYHISPDDVVGEDENGISIADRAYLQSLFGIVPRNGTLYVRSSLDRERVQTVWLKVIANDLMAQSPLTQSATGTIEITIGDRNDNPPSFIPSDVYNVVLSESATVGVEVARIQAVDKDKDPGNIQYFIDDPDAPFEILDDNRIFGLVTLKQLIDREQNTWVNITVKAVDSGADRLASFAALNVQIEDSNDNSPVWQWFNRTLEIWEDVPVGGEITTVFATDQDSGDFGTVMYYIIAGGNGKFAVNNANGKVTTLEGLDRETQAQYQLTFEARDNNLAPENKQLKTPGYMTITLKDVNDNVPQFDQSEYSSVVQENDRVKSIIVAVKATDPDEGLNGVVDYVLDPVSHNISQGLFEVHQSTGDIFIASDLKGTYGTYFLTVLAMDRGNPPKQSSAVVYITIEDINDHPPVILQPPANVSIYIMENVPIATNVTQIFATDQDSGVNGMIIYEFVTSPINNDYQLFNIDANDGWITTNAEIDRERQAVYYLEVRVFDLGVPRREDRRSLRVEVVDEDDNPPMFSRETFPPPYPVSVEEEMADVLVSSVSLAYDPDLNSNALVCYYIVGGHMLYKDHFSLNKTTGDLFLNTPLDREEVIYVDLVIKATEDCVTGFWEHQANRQQEWNESDTSLLLVRVNIEDINDNAPRFTKRWFTAGVTKDTQYGKEVIDLKDYSYDPDIVDNANMFYFISSEMRLSPGLLGRFSSSPFTVDMTDGIIVTNVYFQDDMQGYIEFDINVTDSNPIHADHANVSIYLLHESQRVKVVVRGTPDEVGEFKDHFADFVSNITGAIINVDMIRTHKDATGKPDNRRTDMFIHGINQYTGQVYPDTALIDMIDKNYLHLADLFKTYNVIEVVPAVQAKGTTMAEDLRLAIILLSVLLFLLFLIIIIAFCLYRKKYKRKLKAATAMAFGARDTHLAKQEMPGTNVHAYEGSNPIWLEQYEQGWPQDSDTESKSSVDTNTGQPRHPEYDEQELSVAMYNDDYNDNYNNWVRNGPRPQSADILTAALQQHNAANAANYLNQDTHKPKNNDTNIKVRNVPSYDNLGYDGSDNVASKQGERNNERNNERSNGNLGDLEATEI